MKLDLGSRREADLGAVVSPEAKNSPEAKKPIISLLDSGVEQGLTL